MHYRRCIQHYEAIRHLVRRLALYKFEKKAGIFNFNTCNLQIIVFYMNDEAVRCQRLNDAEVVCAECGNPIASGIFKRN